MVVVRIVHTKCVQIHRSRPPAVFVGLWPAKRLRRNEVKNASGCARPWLGLLACACFAPNYAVCQH